MKEKSKNQVSEPQENQHDFMGGLVTYQVSKETSEAIEYLYKIQAFRRDTNLFLKNFDAYLIPGEEDIHSSVLNELSKIACRIIGDSIECNFNLTSVEKGVVIL